MTGMWTTQASLIRNLIVGTAVAVALLGQSNPAHAVVKFFDGFGDADLNNNGTPLEFADVDVNHNEAVGTYTPGRGTNPPGNTNPEVTTVLDANDVGLRWLFNSGYTNNNVGDPRAYISILDDTQGAMQETKAIVDGGLGITAIDDGYALSWNSKGRGNSAAAFFDETIALGPEVGDMVKISFDFRVWRDAPNANPVEAPADAQIRFGLFEDTDNQLGQTNPVAGLDFDDNGDMIVDPHPAVWGQEGGYFEGARAAIPVAGSNIGSPGDHGWYGQMIIEDPNEPILKHPVPNGGDWRIREEANEGTGNDLRLLNGASDTVAVPQEGTPGMGDFGLVNMDIAKVYNLSLTLERFTDVNPGDTIRGTLTAIDRATGTAYTLSDFEPVVDDGTMSEAWDYFAISNTSTVDDFDLILDNFTLEIIGSGAAGQPGDFNNNNTVDAADYVVWRNAGPTDTLPNDPTPGTVDASDYTLWAANFGKSLGGGSGVSAAAVPEPASLALLVIGGLLATGTHHRNNRHSRGRQHS